MSERSSTLTESTAAVLLAGVIREYDGLRALDGIDCAVARGTLVAIVGANGSGKSTLLRIVAGAIAADAGAIEVLGLRPRTDDAELRRRVGYAAQDGALDPEMTGRETLRLFYALRGLPHREREDRLDRVVDEFSLGDFHDRLIAGYSGGERQRLHLALETLHEPQLMLLDEPTAGLDPAGRDSLWRRASAWRDSGRTVVVVTHDLADVERFCDRVIVLHRGRIAADGSPLELVADHGRATTAITLSSLPADPASLRTSLERAIERGRVALDGAMITIVRTEALESREPALDVLHEHGMSYSRVELSPASLASAFHELTGTYAGVDARVRAGHGRGAGRGGGTGRGDAGRGGAGRSGAGRGGTGRGGAERGGGLL